jgi:HK97 family phage prohead protease/HK97 family phage major capsid protein
MEDYKTVYDFCGWATKNNIKCSDGRTIMKDAFIQQDGTKVPMVWNHQHNDPLNTLGHAYLENRDEGVYMYGIFNDTVPGKQAKSLVQHGDVTSVSIYANQLQQNRGNVLHGVIREVSLVLAGANPGARIEVVHSDDYWDDEEESVLFMNEPLELSHADEKAEENEEEVKEEPKVPAENNEKTVQDVFDELTEEQKNVVYALIGAALEEKGADEDEEGDEDMKHNIFDTDEQNDENVLSHSEMMDIIGDAKRFGSLSESALQHGITNIEYLFPEAKQVTNTPDWIQRDQTWVRKVMNSVHHTPFSRIKSMHADITGDEARALGYIKGHLKKEEVFALLKRSTTPQTVYKKQKLDRDDVIDITDFDVVAWLKGEMRLMLDEELARAFLFGDGRTAGTDDKINEGNIRPIVKDTQANLYAYNANVVAGADADETAKNFIRAAIKARKDYRGTGSPTLYVGADMLSDMLLLEDGFGHALYKTENELATKLRVKEIVEVPDEIIPDDFYGVIVNLNDYYVGADKGGAVNLFDDFDIDYNQMKYLIETRCSGALVKPKSAIVLKKAASEVTPNNNNVIPEGYVIEQERN